MNMLRAFKRRTVRLSFLVFLVVVTLATEVAWQYRPIGWSPERKITNSPADSRIVDVLADPSGGPVYLAWEDEGASEYQVMYQQSPDRGSTWGQAVGLTDSNIRTTAPGPRLASNGRVVLVFYSYLTGVGEHLFYSMKADAGSDFSTPRQLTNDTGYQTDPAAAMVGTTLHLVWQNYVEGSEQIHYARSLDAGKTWEPELALTNSTAQNKHPAVTAIGGSVFVVWSRFDSGSEAVYFLASHNSGATWQPEIQLSDYQPPVISTFPSVSSDGTGVDVAWNGGQLFYAHSADVGSTWESPVPLTNSSRQYLAPKITEMGSRIQVVSAAMLAERPTARTLTITSDIYYLSSLDGGKNWGQPISLTNQLKGNLALAPSITVRDDDTWVAWQDNSDGRFAVFISSKPDFVILQSFETELELTLLAVLTAGTAVYLALELKRPRRVRRHARRIKRARRKSRRR